MKTYHRFVLLVVGLCSAYGLLQGLSLMDQGSTRREDKDV